MHLSPVFRKEQVRADDVHHDLSILTKYYTPRFVKILGGEPLLHPDLASICAAIRATGISDSLRVCTNGVRLARMPDAFWREVDEVEISLYPGCELSEEDIAVVHDRASSFGVKLSAYRYSHFRESTAELGTRNDGLVKRIYATCQVAHVWRCHTVIGGYFFKCPQAAFLPRVLRDNARPWTADGIEIVDAPQFRARLFDYLNSGRPLHACRQCLGTSGRLIAHQQESRRQWMAPQRAETETLVDHARLDELERHPDAPDGCATPVSLATYPARL